MPKTLSPPMPGIGPARTDTPTAPAPAPNAAPGPLAEYVALLLDSAAPDGRVLELHRQCRPVTALCPHCQRRVKLDDLGGVEEDRQFVQRFVNTRREYGAAVEGEAAAKLRLKEALNAFEELGKKGLDTTYWREERTNRGMRVSAATGARVSLENELGSLRTCKKADLAAAVDAME